MTRTQFNEAILDDIYDCMFRDYFESSIITEFQANRDVEQLHSIFEPYTFDICVSQRIRFKFIHKKSQGEVQFTIGPRENALRYVVDFLNNLTFENATIRSGKNQEVQRIIKRSRAPRRNNKVAKARSTTTQKADAGTRNAVHAPTRSHWGRKKNTLGRW